MRLQHYTTLVCTLLLCGACAIRDPDPPALPDDTRFVPPAVVLPTTEPPPAAPLLVALEQAPLVTVPPADAIASLAPPPAPVPGKRRRASADPVEQATRASLVTPRPEHFGAGTMAMQRFAYRIGAVYQITVSPTAACALVLPTGLRIADKLNLDEKQWEVRYVESGEDDERQEYLVVRPVEAGLEATVPLIAQTGHLFLLRFISRVKPGVLAVTWELPFLPVRPHSSTTKPPQDIQAPKINLARLHVQYRIETDRKHPVSWVPAEVYDDSAVSVVRFAHPLDYTAAPVLMAVSVDGKQTLPVEYVTYNVPGHPEHGEFYVTKGIYPRLRLLDGQHGTVDLVRLPTPAPAYVEERHETR